MFTYHSARNLLLSLFRERILIKVIGETY